MVLHIKIQANVRSYSPWKNGSNCLDPSADLRNQTKPDDKSAKKLLNAHTIQQKGFTMTPGKKCSS